jgi:hypothetical protein
METDYSSRATPRTPLQVLHPQVSVEDLSNEQLEALDRFTQSLIGAKQQ